MGKGISGLTITRWHQTKWFAELISGIPPIAVAGVAAYQLSSDPVNGALGYLSIGATLWMVVASIIKIGLAARQDRRDAPAFEHEGLRGALHVLHAAAARASGLTAEEGRTQIRATFHRVVPPVDQAEKYEQITDYVGRTSSGVGRIFDVRSGIVGLAIRSGDAYLFHRQDSDSTGYLKELIKNWGFRPREAKNISMDAMCWLAVPVRDALAHETLGVIYLDSTDPDTFTTSNEFVLAACMGFTQYVHKRY